MSGRYPLSPYFGDYPNGRYISAFPAPGAGLDDDDLEVRGVIRFRMPEHEVDFPLWDDEGALPEETELLEAGLGVSGVLVADLMAWGAAWNDGQPRTREEHERDRERLRAEAVVLVDRMRQELNDGLQVVLDL